jgi:hypothetical protein
VLGLEHPSVAESYNYLALVTCDMRADAEALQFSEKCMSIARKYYAPDHPQFLNYLGNSAIVLVGGHDAQPGVQP